MPSLTLDSSGRLSLPGHVAREIGSRPLRIVSCSEGHLLVTAAAEEAGVVLAGTLDEIAAADLLSFLNMFRRTGTLRFHLSGGSRELYLQNGEVVFAASTFPEDDLGEVLSTLGRVDRASLQKARAAADGRVTVGKILVERGAVTPKELWSATRRQVESIVYALFALQAGSFSFLPRFPKQAAIVRLSLNTQNLIMEGLRRVDERALFRRLIPSPDLVPVLACPERAGATPAEERLLALVAEGGRAVREVLRQSGLGEFEALSALYRLVEKGAVGLEEPLPPTAEGAAADLLRVFNGVLAALYRRVAEKNPDFNREIRLFLRDLPQPYVYVFLDVPLLEDGSLDSGRIVANLAGLEEGEKKKLLADAMSELVFMECFAARRDLGPEQSEDLVRKVQEISRRAKDLIGRK